MTDVREKLAEIMCRATCSDTECAHYDCCQAHLLSESATKNRKRADAILAACPELTAAPGKDVVEGAREIAAQNAKYAWAVPGGFALDRKWLERAITALTTACVAREREACAKIAEGRRLNEQGGVWCDEDRYRVQEGEAIAECIRAGGSK